MVLLALIVTRSSVSSLQARHGLPLGNLVVGWFVLGKLEALDSKGPGMFFLSDANPCVAASLVLPFLHRLYPNSHYLHRLMVIFLTFSPTFIILTISYEGLFYFVFCMTLVTWVRFEHAIYVHTGGSSPKKPRHTNTATVQGQTYRYRALSVSDARVALFFFFLLQAAFFSTGNVASLASFSMDSVRRLIPVFSPFSQAALLIFQILIPFAIISANLGILNRRLEVAPSALFMVVMAISDVMTLNFFYMVRDEGSWLDIGMTISHFCISSFLCTFVAGLEFLSEVFVSGVDFGPTASALGAKVSQAVNGSVECGHERSSAESQHNGVAGNRSTTGIDGKSKSTAAKTAVDTSS